TVADRLRRTGIEQLLLCPRAQADVAVFVGVPTPEPDLPAAQPEAIVDPDRLLIRHRSAPTHRIRHRRQSCAKHASCFDDRSRNFCTPSRNCRSQALSLYLLARQAWAAS